ncbi:MAG: ribonuclease H-like domain-containing protein [Candidatus Latescibacteria bacterium]|nr:ribonuclease H-like domain-containing protein [Candidatus Latescibacterota bacterium]
MLSENMRKRIASLNRRDLKHEDEVEVGDEKEPEAKPAPRKRAPRAQEMQDPLPLPQDLRVMATAADARLRLRLDEVAQGMEIPTEAGQFFLIDQSLNELLPGGDGFRQHYVKVMKGLNASNVPSDPHNTFEPLIEAKAENVIYVDIEATGLTAGTPLFLVGVLGYWDGDLRIQQMLARDYTEEAALLSYFSNLFSASDVVVSFNGKSYDLPYIRDRSIFMGIPFQLRQAHIDMLHVGRRRWRKRLPNCKLQTLEQYICKRVRRGDIPGADIPDAYHRFVESGNAVQMRDILHHNALDLLTTAEVLTFVLDGRDV